MMSSPMTRRTFVATSLAAGCASAPEPETESETLSPSKMTLSMSVRVAESFSNKKESSMTIEELIALAKTQDYQALCMRASTAGIHSAKQVISEYSGKIDEAGLKVSMVTGDFVVPMNNDEGPSGLRNITPYLDLAESFGSDLIRICMKKEEDIEWAQRASDEALERGIRLAHQSHCNSMFETVESAVDVLTRVGKENFGIIYEPANWFVAGEAYGRDGIERVRPWIMNVYVQNHRLNPDGEAQLVTWKSGPVGVDHIGIWEQGGVNFEEVFATLGEIGYEGYVTVHQAFEGVMTVKDAVDKSAKYLRSQIG